MRLLRASLSVVFGIIASVLVFTPYFKTPPMPIFIFSVLGIIVGASAIKEAKALSFVGILLSVASLGYLILLFIRLGG